MHVFVAILDYRNDLKHQNIVTEILAVEPVALVKFKTVFLWFWQQHNKPPSCFPRLSKTIRKHFDHPDSSSKF